MSQLVRQLMHDDLIQPVPDGLAPLLEKLQQRFGSALEAVVLYGSCRRIDNTGEGLVDLMALVSSYHEAHGWGLTASFNRLLPPNVYYLEADSALAEAKPGLRIRCKFIVISQAQFSRRCRRGLDAYFWARFTQPCRVVWSGRAGMAQQLANDRANAAELFAKRAARIGDAVMSAEAFWVRALSASYGCELRPEPQGAAAKLVAHDLLFWDQLTASLEPSLPTLRAIENENKNKNEKQQYQQYQIELSGGQRRLGKLDWKFRSVWGKCLNVLRLLKAAGTFANGLDYLVWKVERHSGIRVEPTERMRKHPRIAAWGLVFRLWREGAFR